MSTSISNFKYNATLYLNEAKTALKEKFKNILNAFKYPKAGMKCFYCLTVIAILCFIVSYLQNGFKIPLNGDYSVQMMEFIYNQYDDWHHFFKTGEFILWDRSVFLGVDNIGGNSFYYLFDPLFLLMLPFPRSWLQTLQGLQFIPRMVIAGMLFYGYLKELHVSEKTRIIGAIAFAFNGYYFNTIWFHFMESTMYLPLVFWGIEKIIKKQDPRIFLVSFFLIGMTNFFFFAVFLLGGFFYAMFRYLQTLKKRNFKDNINIISVGLLSFVVALLLGCTTLLPGLKMATSMPRVQSSSFLSQLAQSSSLGEFIHILTTQDKPHNQVTPLLNFLFMNDDCFYSNLLNVNYYDNYQANMYATSPFLLLFFVGLFDAIKNKRWSYLIATALVMFLIFTPFGYYLFSGFTLGYARFFSLITCWHVTFSCITLDRRRDIPKKYLDLSYAIVLALYVVSTFLILYEVELTPQRFTASTYWDMKMILIPIQTIWVTVCFIVMRHFFATSKLHNSMFFLVAIDVIAMSYATIYGQGVNKAYKNEYYEEETKIVNNIKKMEGDKDFYRISNTNITRNNINASMQEGYSGMGAFHSSYAFSTQDFLDRSRIPYSYKNWSMGVHNNRNNLEGFLGVKYYITDRVDETQIGMSIPKAYPERKDKNGNTKLAESYCVPYGYKNLINLSQKEADELNLNVDVDFIKFLRSDDCNKSVYVNLNFIDTGFGFDNIIDAQWLMTNTSSYLTNGTFLYNKYEDINEYPILRYCMLDDSDFKRFSLDNRFYDGTLTYYGGKETNIDITKSNLASQAIDFQDSLVELVNPLNYTPYSGKKPIARLYQGPLKETVYKSNWPGTMNRPSGEYAMCDPTNPYDQSCLNDWKTKEPFKYANGIYPGDTVYDMSDKNFDKKCLYSTKVLIERSDGGLIAPKESYPNGAYISLDSNLCYEWRLFDENLKLIQSGLHSFSNYKYAHGYYTNRPVKYILGILKEGTFGETKTVNPINVYIQDLNDYQSAIDNLKKNKINILSRSENTMNFTTNYDRDKFVVLNYPNEEGFKIQEKVLNKKTGKYELNNIETFKAQGGFISFEALKGDHEYILTYSNKYYKIGGILSFIGLMVTGIFIFFITVKNNREKLFYESSLRYNIQTYIDKEKERYINYETDTKW